MNPATARHLEVLGLARAPFPPTPDADAWFQTAQLDAALTEAAHGLRTRAGFVLLTGEVGTGKSTFLRRLMQQLEGEGVVISLVFNTFLQGPDLLVAVLRDFGLRTRGNPAADIRALNTFLIQRWRAQTTCVLIIDDAQNLDLESLELLRLLTSLETGQEKLLQIVLAGQPELRANLDDPAIRQLTSRICTHIQLRAMDARQLRHYVDFRLADAGNPEPGAPEPGIRVTDGAIRALHRHSGGNPRRAHLIMDRCLYGMYGRPPAQRVIDTRLVGTAAAEAGAKRPRRRVPMALAASLSGVLALGALALAWWPNEVSSTAVAPAPVVQPVTPAPVVPDAWQACLDALGGPPLQLQKIDPAWLQALPSRNGLCVRHAADGWRAAWRPGLDATDFVASGEASPRLLDVQALLHMQGLYDGRIDGRYGPHTRDAIARLQQRHRLPATGIPDPMTLHLLDALLADATLTQNESATSQHEHG